MQATTNSATLRLDPRSQVMLMVTVSAGASSQPVIVRNLSANGALIEGHDLPGKGAPTNLRRGRLEARGVVAWREGAHCGVRFNRPINVRDWVKRVGSDGQRAVDTTMAALRRDRAWPDPNAATAVPRRDRAVGAGEKLLEICERIASLPGLSVELAEELIHIDTIAQLLISDN